MFEVIKSKLSSLGNKIAYLIQRVTVTESSPVTPGAYPLVQVSNTSPRKNQPPTFNKTSSMENISPYGLASSLPLNALCTKFNLQGQSSNPVGLAYDPMTLPALLVGEIAIGAFSATIPTYMKFTNKGTIEVWKSGVIVISDLITHIHSGVTTGPGVSGPPVT